MTGIREDLSLDGTPLVRLENRFLQVDVAPSVGGRVVSLVDLATGHQFLWRNARLRLEKLPPGSAYDPNFYGGIDELLPNDIPELLNGVDSPDHGELWTMALDHRIEGSALVLSGTLPLCGLEYRRRMELRSDGPYLDLDYRIYNPTSERRVFLWKLHAALAIEPGDRIECPARTARVADPQWSRWTDVAPFPWPTIQGQRADIIPPKEGTVDFLFLYDLQDGRMAWRSAHRDLTFVYIFDRRVFPYAWYFASYGGFDDHYVAILEPCTAMPLSVNEAARLGQCSVLDPGQAIETRVTIYAGR
ncbi:MAG: DUF5107 domain-containing protein [Anaerolineae bacterium]|nr:DUF5107 domain-containing protein [Anaerolineae bacterium]MDW8100490.1 DUF5107 domain-containing protein [Anaerolineae bacterium]